MWASIATFFTSPALFILLNIVIVIILFISRLSSSHANDTDNHVTPLARALHRVKSIDFSISNYNFTPSNYSQPQFYNPIQRVKSINFSFNKFFHHHQQDHEDQPPQPLPRAPSILERVKSIDFTALYNRSDSGRLPNPASSEADLHPQSRGSDPVHLTTSKSDQGKVTQRKASKAKMKKSASELFRREEGEQELERRRPATMKPEKSASGETGDVDAKADDFINRFKQQLKLQRLDSLLRYKEMLNPK